MRKDKVTEEFVKNLLLVFPNWHSRLVRPFKDTLNGEMSLETYYCLETLRMQGTATMTELARQLKVPKQQVTKLVDKLGECCFIERLHTDADRRVTRIRLTPRAIEYLDQYHLKNAAFIRSLEEQLTGEEIGKLNEAMKDLLEILPKLK